MWQHEIKKTIPLLDKKGNLTEPGWSKKLLPVYNRSAIKAPAARIKEWDYYLVTNGHFAVALTIADNGYMGLDSISFLNFDIGEQTTKSPIRAMPMGKTGLPGTSKEGVSAISGKGYGMTFLHVDGKELGPARQLLFRMDDFADGQPIQGSIMLFDEPEDSMVICTPFDKPGHFYFNQKINCMRASGTVTVGNHTYQFDPADSFGVLDWGRGVWTYSNTWYWSSASGLVDGVPFGFNLGYGFGNGSAATENVLIYNGKVHKLSHVKFKIPGKPGREDFMSPWTFTSDNGRLELQFVPIMNRASNTDLKLLKSDQNQVFGHFSGRVVLDDGTPLQIKNLLGFAEKVVNKW